MEVQPFGKCKKHPRYLYKQQPKPTKAYPKGCPTCWDLWKKREHLRIEAAKAKIEEIERQKKLPGRPIQKGEVLNPHGSTGKPSTIHEYARRKLKNGKMLVDKLIKMSGLKKDEIEELLTNPASVKDQVDIIKTLYKIMKDDEVADKPQDIRVIVLNVKDATFEEYQRGRDTT